MALTQSQTDALNDLRVSVLEAEDLGFLVAEGLVEDIGGTQAYGMLLLETLARVEYEVRAWSSYEIDTGAMIDNLRDLLEI